MKIVWFAWWEGGNVDWHWQLFQTENCFMCNLGRLTIGIQKTHTWKYIIKP